jgi:tetratricopeptide (TPR) repeat protein
MTSSSPPLPDSYEGLLSRAQVTANSGDVLQAIELYRRVTEKLSRLSDRVLDRRPQLRGYHVQARLELANLLRFEGRHAEAIEVIEVLLESDPEKADRWRQELAILRLSKGETETGLAELRTLAQEEAEDAERWLVYGAEARIEGQFGESQAALEQGLDIASGDQDPEMLAELCYQQFELYRQLGRLDEATAAWEQAVEHNAEITVSIQEVYAMLTDAGRYSDALRYVERDENALLAGLQRGLIANLTGRPGEARQEWERVAALDPTEFDYGHEAWVECVLRLGDSEPALEWLQDYLPRYGTPRLLVLSGIGWAMRDDSELAAGLFQQAISLLRRLRPPKQKLDSADWHLLDSIVDDEEIKAPLKSYFAVIETPWG